MPLFVLLEQRLLVEGGGTHVALEFELVVHPHVMVEVSGLQELLLALITFEGKGHAVRLHVRVQLRLLLEGLLRALGAVVAGDARMALQVLVQRGHLRELLGALRAAVLLHLVVRLHVVVEVGHLRKGSAALGLDAHKGTFPRVQPPVII